MLKKLYRLIVPKCVRRAVGSFRLRKVYRLRSHIVNYLKEQAEKGDMEFQKMFDFYKTHDYLYICFPYSFTEKYSADHVAVFHDGTGFPYVLHNGRKMYGKKGWSNAQLAQYYARLLLEQDEKSPHRYLFPDRLPQKGAVVADVGAAEGIFALDVLPYASKVYLFECEQEWTAALRLTFAEELKNGTVEIVEAFVGAQDNAGKKVVTLDSFFADKRLDYVKADIEGAEEDMIEGGGMYLRIVCRQSCFVATTGRLQRRRSGNTFPARALGA